MTMDNTEIVIAYKNAKNKKEQIKILAELNLCSEEKIIEILKDNGLRPGTESKGKKRIPKTSELCRIKAKEAAERLALQNLAGKSVELKDTVIELPKDKESKFNLVLEDLMDGALDSEIKSIELKIERLKARKKNLEALYKALATAIGS